MIDDLIEHVNKLGEHCLGASEIRDYQMIDDLMRQLGPKQKYMALLLSFSISHC
jgi:hypothetical protein